MLNEMVNRILGCHGLWRGQMAIIWLEEILEVAKESKRNDYIDRITVYLTRYCKMYNIDKPKETSKRKYSDI